jgi:hypothetical protein
VRCALFQDDGAACALDLGVGLQPEAVDDGLGCLLERDALASFTAEGSFEVLPEAVQVRDVSLSQIFSDVKAESVEFAALIDFDSAADGSELATRLHHKPREQPFTESAEFALHLVLATRFHGGVFRQPVCKSVTLGLNDRGVCHCCSGLGGLKLFDQLRVHAIAP